MDIKETQAHYEKLGAALRAFIQGFEPKAPPGIVRKAIEGILDLAEKIGEPLREEADLFREAGDEFLKQRGDPRSQESLLKQALRLEQETREI